MSETTLLVLAIAFVGFAALSGRLSRTVLTPPLLFASLGLALGDAGLGLLNLSFDREFLDVIAEFTLILVLFTDAAKIDFNKLQHEMALPVRTLLVGMPLVIAVGTAVALWLPLEIGLFEAALLAAILAPTDAALGQAVVTSPQVPERLRRALNVESGLNDGIALPLVLFFAACASLGHGAEMDRNWITFSAGQLLLGPLAGTAVGWIGAVVINWSSQRNWLAPEAEGAGAIGLAVASFLLAELIGGNGFIAAFVAGITFGHRLQNTCKFLFEFMESEGQLLVLFTFTVFGASLLPLAIEGLSWPVFGYALMSLTVIRVVPIMLSLLGAKVSIGESLFLAWFGPRGLASILFAVLIFDEMVMGAEETLLSTIFLTVALSIVAHGVTALPASRLFKRQEPVTEEN